MFKVKKESDNLLKKLLEMNSNIDDCIKKQKSAINEIEKLQTILGGITNESNRY